jgi:DNA polymerase-1
MLKPLILVDGSSYFYRAFHALPPLVTSLGKPTGAIYGVVNMIRRLIKDYNPDQIAVVFDSKGKTFRNDLYPEYKAHRPPTPKDLSCQFEPLIEALDAFGLPILTIEYVEADDVIGTIATTYSQKNNGVIISTGDKDMAQLVNENVTLINTMSNSFMDAKGVKDKFGVHPNQIVDYLTLIGDTADNIKGVHKCGPKTAAKWLDEYKNLDNIIINADKITGKIGENLREFLPMIELSRKLVTIKTDVELPISSTDFNIKKPDIDKLLKLGKEFEFNSWAKEFSQSDAFSSQEVFINKAEHQYDIIQDIDSFNLLLNNITKADLLCVDTETTSLDTISAELVGIALAIDEKMCAYIPLTHETNDKQLDLNYVLASLKPILEDVNIKKLGQNLKYDYEVFKKYGIELDGILYDTMLESYLLNSSNPRHDMDSLALKHLNHTTIKYTDVTGVGKKQIPFRQVSINEAAKYSTEDVDVTLRLHKALYNKLDDKLKSVLHTIEVPLLTVLANIELYGVLIDTALLKEHGIRLNLEIDNLRAKAVMLAGHDFNLNSPKQLQAVLFDELKLPIINKTPTGQPSTSEEVLQELAFSYELPAIILRYRSLAKLVSTYIEALPKKVNPKTMRVHTSYNQAVTATGRLSSSDPNLQNIPIRSEEGRLIRKAFVAPDKHLLLTADYSQIELRIMAHLSQDKALLEAFKEGLDIHAATASEIFDVNLKDVTNDQRRKAKAINFGLIYGMSEFGLAKQLQISRIDAKEYITCYFNKYPGVLDYMENTKKMARENGFVETIFGRRLYLPEINAKNIMVKKAAERTAINAPLQGTAADIIKKAMLDVAANQCEKNYSAVMVMQVHDELVFEVPEHKIDIAKDNIKALMEGAAQLSVPLTVSIGVGKNWDEAH